MNKLFIGLLVIAAGAGIFFFACSKKQKSTSTTFDKSAIVGHWKAGSTSSSDSNFSKYEFDFQKEGRVIRSLNDSLPADTSNYEWTKKDQLVWKEKSTDSTGNTYSVLKLNNDSLQIQSADSITVLFTKIK